jgi:hypothetical protein
MSNKSTLCKRTFLLLTAVILLSLLPLSVSAASATVDITDKSIAVIQSEIDDALSAASGKEIVTITGTGTVTRETGGLVLDIAAEVRVR